MFDVLVGTILIKDGKVLMVKENKDKEKGLLNLPAGHLESGESLIEGAKREVLEETGLKVDITGLVNTAYFTSKEKEYIAFFFQGEILEEYNENDKELEFDFFDIEFLRKNKKLMRLNGKLILTALNKIEKMKAVVIDALDGDIL